MKLAVSKPRQIAIGLFGCLTILPVKIVVLAVLRFSATCDQIVETGLQSSNPFILFRHQIHFNFNV